MSGRIEVLAALLEANPGATVGDLETFEQRAKRAAKTKREARDGPPN